MADIDKKFSGRGSDEHKNWAEVVIEVNEPGYIAIFNDAWQEFQLARKAAKDAVD
jgi:hypothetical protein